MRNGDKRTAEPSVSSLKPKNSFPLLSFSFLFFFFLFFFFFFFFVNSRPVCFSPVAGHKCTQCNSTGIWRSSTLRLNLFPRMCVRLLLWEYMACNRFFVPFYPQKFTLLFRPFRFFFLWHFYRFRFPEPCEPTTTITPLSHFRILIVNRTSRNDQLTNDPTKEYGPQVKLAMSKRSI